MDRLNAMSLFVKTVETGSFSAAAKVLRVSPQLVGKQVSELEKHLGVTLLQRSTRRQSLTDAGQRFLDRARTILAEVDAAEDLAAESRAAPSGRLRVNAPVSFGSHVLAAALPEYLRRHPQVAVDLKLSNRMVDLIDEGFDVVFRIGELRDSGLIARALTPYQLILCATPGYLAKHPRIRSPADLTAHNCLGFSLIKPEWTLQGPSGITTVPVTGPFTADLGEPLLAAGLAGLGVVFLPSEVVAPALKGGRLVELLPKFPAPPLPMHLLYGSDRRLTPKLRTFIDFAVEKFGK